MSAEGRIMPCGTKLRPKPATNRIAVTEAPPYKSFRLAVRESDGAKRSAKLASAMGDIKRAKSAQKLRPDSHNAQGRVRMATSRTMRLPDIFRRHSRNAPTR